MYLYNGIKKFAIFNPAFCRMCSNATYHISKIPEIKGFNFYFHTNCFFQKFFPYLFAKYKNKFMANFRQTFNNDGIKNK